MNKTKTLFYSIIAFSLALTSCTTATKDDPTTNTITKPTINPTTVSDIDGNIYHTVTIGTQTWLVENLKTTKYRNGNLIGTTSPATKNIGSELGPRYQWAYNGDETNVVKYGRLYTWYAVIDTRNIAPTGWHIPTNAEWTTLETYLSTHLGTSVSVAKALASTTDWTINSNASAIGNNLSINNYSVFSALPGGNRDLDGRFSSAGNGGYWWSSTENNTNMGSNRWLYYNNSYVYDGSNFKSYGYSVRCLRDSN